MSLPDRRRFLGLMLALPLGAGLSACGFEPVYGPNGAGTALRNQIAFQAPETIGAPSHVRWAAVASNPDGVSGTMAG